MSEHTKGSWRVSHGDADCISIEAYYPDEEAWWSIAIIELDEHGAEPTPEQEANAKLIASAPDMLAMLKEVEEFLNVAPFDFRNGNTHAGLDEGEVIGWGYTNKLADQIKAIIDEVEPKP